MRRGIVLLEAWYQRLGKFLVEQDVFDDRLHAANRSVKRSGKLDKRDCWRLV